MKKIITVASLLSLAMMAGTLQAKVSSQEVAKLGKSLTPMGAQMAGNASGTIPAWTGGFNSDNTAKSADAGRPINILKDEKPLFTITNATLAQYKENLSPGQLALFAKYPDYAMPIYTSHRTSAYSKEMYDIVKRNAANAELLNNGDGIGSFELATPFPIPKTGVEIIWNHITRFRGGSASRSGTIMPVHTNGDFSVVKYTDRVVFPEYFKGGRTPGKDDNVLFYYLSRITAPARLTGTALLINETMDQVKEPRRAWVYNSGQRRVRRAPNVAYDGPADGTDGLRTSDNYDMYNGSPDRYNWKLVGKKELYIPYNAYKLMDQDTKYTSIIGAGHLNAEHLRYELHRVWEVEATLKEGARHVYGKRTMFFDEDTWTASVADHYDSRGELWRVSEGHNIQFHDANASWFAAETLHDLNSGRYLVTGLSNEEPKFIKWGGKAARNEFSTSALRRMGR
ncbi:MAG: DUF1329 domain-containing protein [Bermanella sp.]